MILLIELGHQRPAQQTKKPLYALFDRSVDRVWGWGAQLPVLTEKVPRHNG